MCGRIVQKTNLGNVVSNLGMDSSEAIASGLVDRAPRYNIAPGASILAVRSNSNFSYLKWGLIPSWAKDPKIGFKLSNARSETVQEKPSFRSAFKARRCVIPVDGFYEWKLQDGKKKPYFIHCSDEELLLLAGLWESWRSPTGEEIETCCVLTTSAVLPIQSIHDRMPVFVKRRDLEEWLGPETNSKKLTSIFSPSNTLAEIILTPVSSVVNSATIDNESCIAHNESEPLHARSYQRTLLN